MRHVLPTVACAVVVGSLLVAREAPPLLPNVTGSLKMVVIGDNGTGSREQSEVAEQMASFRQQFRYDLVLMVGDNFYGAQRPSDLAQKFARPYKPLLDAGVIARAFGLHLPSGIGWRELTVIGLIASVGFTVALFFASESIGPGPALSAIRMGALMSVAGVFAAIGAAALLRTGRFARAV